MGEARVIRVLCRNGLESDPPLFLPSRRLMSIVLERQSNGFSYENLQRRNVEATHRPLKDEIFYLRQNYRREGLPEDWYRMSATGFQVDKQTNLLFSQLNTDDTPTERFFQKQRWLTQTDGDIKGFIIEYLTEKLVFPIHYTILPEEKRVVDRFYGNKDVEDIVSSEERNGSVKRSIKKVKDFFLDAKDGSIAVMTSPAGWSGMKLSNGDSIVYPDSQTYIWKKQENEVWGFTVKTDFSYEEHRELLKRLTFQTLPEDAPVTQYVETVAGIIPGDHSFDIKDIVNIMRDVRFDTTGGLPFAFKNRMWNEVYKDLDRREELWKYDVETEKIVQEFKNYFLSHDLSEKEIQEALSVTILRIARFLRSDKIQTRSSRSFSDNSSTILGSLRYGDILDDVQKIPGCAGGGSTKINSITPRAGIFGSDEHGALSFECPSCGMVNVREKGKLKSQCDFCKSTEVACKEPKNNVAKNTSKVVEIEEFRKKNEEKTIKMDEKKAV